MADKFLQSLDFGDGNKRYPLPLIQQPYTQRAEHSVGHMWETVYNGGVYDMVFDADHTGMLFFAPESGGVYGYNLNNLCDSVGLPTELIVTRLIIIGDQLVVSTTTDGIWWMSLGTIGTWNYVGDTAGLMIDQMEYDSDIDTIYYTLQDGGGIYIIQHPFNYGGSIFEIVIINTEDKYFKKISIGEGAYANLAIGFDGPVYRLDKDDISTASVIESVIGGNINFIKYFDNIKTFVIGTEAYLYTADSNISEVFGISDETWISERVSDDINDSRIPSNFKDIIRNGDNYFITCGSCSDTTHSDNLSGCFLSVSSIGPGTVSDVCDHMAWATIGYGNNGETFGLIEIVDGNIIISTLDGLAVLLNVILEDHTEMADNVDFSDNQSFSVIRYAKYEDDILFMAFNEGNSPGVKMSKYQNETVPCPQEGKVLKVVDGKWAWGSLT